MKFETCPRCQGHNSDCPECEGCGEIVVFDSPEEAAEHYKKADVATSLLVSYGRLDPEQIKRFVAACLDKQRLLDSLVLVCTQCGFKQPVDMPFATAIRYYHRLTCRARALARKLKGRSNAK